MSDLFEEDVEVGDGFEEIDVDDQFVDKDNHGIDARRRLENMLDERRLRDELDDFLD